jgi:hypothetical protein
MFDGGSSGTFVFRSGGDITLGTTTAAIPAAGTVIVQGNSENPGGFIVNLPAASNGTLRVTSQSPAFPVTLLSNGPVFTANGTINIDAGMLRSEGFVHFGENPGDTATINISNTGELLLPTTATVGGREFIGYGGAATINQSGGINQDANMLILGALSTGQGTYNLTGGTLNDQREFIGDAGTGIVNQSGGVHNAARFMIIANATGSSGTFNLNGGSFTTPTLTVNTGGVMHWNAGTVSRNNLTIAGGLVTMAATGGAKVLQAQTLDINAGGKLDIGNNKVIVNLPLSVGTLGSGNTYTGVTGLIQSGHNGGAWNGPGIMTSQSAAATSTFTSIGVATAAQVKGIAATDTAVWSGVTVSGNDTLVMYTYGGDANLDGKIDVLDYGRIDLNSPLGTSGWFNGDFNYDGKIDIQDYGIIDFNIGIQGAPFPTGEDPDPPPPASATTALPGVTAVPEPTLAIPLLSVAVATGLRRRHRRTRRCP